MRIDIRTGAGSRMIGEYDPAKNVYEKKVKESKHLLKVLDAWGIDARYFNEVLLPKNATVRITDTESRKVYSLAAEDIKRHGQMRTYGAYGTQIFCPRAHWAKAESQQSLL